MTASSTTRSLYVETFGCQMNQLDSELVLGQLRALGYRLVDRSDQADVVLYNTCSVREHAEEVVRARLGDAKHLKKANPALVLGVLGCMAERDAADLVKKFPHVDLLCGPAELDKVPLLIDNAARTRQRQTALAGHATRRSSTLEAAADDLEMLDLSRSISASDHRGAAYVRITRGCNKFCTYCVVPFTRGAEVHRPPDHIVEECRRLAEAGVIEVTLLGQTVNHYRYDHGASVQIGGLQQPQVGPGGAAFRDSGHPLNTGRRITRFSDLLKRIHDQVPQILRLRFVTSYPRDFGDDILQVMTDSPRICRYLHVPAQSGSDRILKLMNRDYTAGEYVDFIDRTRHYLPDVTLASDFIVGFPTETEEDFHLTRQLVRRCRFKNSFIFKYSPRPGTVAIDRFTDDVPDEIKKRRNQELLEEQAVASQQIHEAMVGREIQVLVEGVSARARRKQGNVELGWEKDHESVQLSGRTAGDLIVLFDGDPAMVGRIVTVKVDSARPLALFGRLQEHPAAV